MSSLSPRHFFSNFLSRDSIISPTEDEQKIDQLDSSKVQNLKTGQLERESSLSSFASVRRASISSQNSSQYLSNDSSDDEENEDVVIRSSFNSTSSTSSKIRRNSFTSPLMIKSSSPIDPFEENVSPSVNGRRPSLTKFNLPLNLTKSSSFSSSTNTPRESISTPRNLYIKHDSSYPSTPLDREKDIKERESDIDKLKRNMPRSRHNSYDTASPQYSIRDNGSIRLSSSPQASNLMPLSRSSSSIPFGSTSNNSLPPPPPPSHSNSPVNIHYSLNPSSTTSPTNIESEYEEQDMYGNSKLHQLVISYPLPLNLIEKILKFNKNYATRVNYKNKLPIHYALDLSILKKEKEFHLLNSSSYVNSSSTLSPLKSLLVLLKLLLDADPSSIHSKDSNGNTPLDIAYEWNHPKEIIKLLKKYKKKNLST